jgi:uncharacterized membrane protein
MIVCIDPRLCPVIAAISGSVAPARASQVTAVSRNNKAYGVDGAGGDQSRMIGSDHNAKVSRETFAKSHVLFLVLIDFALTL